MQAATAPTTHIDLMILPSSSTVNFMMRAMLLRLSQQLGDFEWAMTREKYDLSIEGVLENVKRRATKS